MKRTVYLIGFTFLGFLLSLLLHAVIELGIIELLVTDYEKYGLGLRWSTWFLLHHVMSVVLTVAGLTFGYRQGVKWWSVIYGTRQE